MRPLLFCLPFFCFACGGAGADADAGVKFKDRGVFEDVGDGFDAGSEDTLAPLDANAPDAMAVVDSDGDGIPDPDDPEPMRAQRRLFADTFEDTEQGWIFSSVNMGIAPAVSLLQVVNIEPYEREGWIGPRPDWGSYLVRAMVRINGVGTSESPQSGHVGLMVHVNQVTPSRYLTCGVDLKNGRIVLVEHQGTRRTTLAMQDATILEGSWFLVHLTIRNGFYVCRIAGYEVSARSTAFVGGAIGFRTYDSAFAADWIEVHDLD